VVLIEIEKMITEEIIHQQFYCGNPFLRFNGPVYDTTPRNFITLIDLIKKESEWKDLSLPVKKDKYGNYSPIVKKGLYFGFQSLISANSIEIQAINTGKKCTQYPWNIYPLIRQGCKYYDFVFIPDDIKSYCEAKILFQNDKKEEALKEIQKSYHLKPEEHYYASLLFEIRLDLNDETTVDEEIKYFENDIDSLVHTNRIYKLIRFLTRKKKNAKALQLIQLTNQYLDDLSEGRKQNKIFNSQKADWYIYQKQQFNKRIEKTKLKLESQSMY
jgi:hypothetical protein